MEGDILPVSSSYPVSGFGTKDTQAASLPLETFGPEIRETAKLALIWYVTPVLFFGCSDERDRLEWRSPG